MKLSGTSIIMVQERGDSYKQLAACVEFMVALYWNMLITKVDIPP